MVYINHGPDWLYVDVCMFDVSCSGCRPKGEPDMVIIEEQEDLSLNDNKVKTLKAVHNKLYNSE